MIIRLFIKEKVIKQPEFQRININMDYPSSNYGSNQKGDDETMKLTTATLLSLHQDVWSECLKFLSPQDMAMTSTKICKGLMSSSSSSNQMNNVGKTYDEPLERASWLALESAMGKADRILASLLPPSSTQGQQECSSFVINRYPGETWIEMYTLFYSLVNTVQKLWSHENDMEESNGLINDSDSSSEESSGSGDVEGAFEIAKKRNHIAWIATCWLLFGWPSPEKHPPITLLSSSCKSIGYGNYMSMLGSLLHQKISQQSTEFKSRYRIRLLQTAVRLSDVAGDWQNASTLLTSILIVDNDDNKSSLEGGDPLPQSQQHIKQLAEINICICTFLIDRLYSNTYVRAESYESEALSQAVILGRKAVSLCRQSQYQQMARTDNDNSEVTNDKIDNLVIESEYDQLTLVTSRQQQPPAASLLYSSDPLRIAAAHLALGKALALLAQHIGLGATNIRDVEVRPIEGGEEEAEMEVEEENIRRARVESRFFREGEAILKASIHAMEEEESELLTNKESFKKCDLFEVKVATYAALGELHYCSASVESYFDFERVSRQTQKSIKFLKRSLCMVQERLVYLLGGKTPTVQGICSIAPRSLLMLQARTAKDLGKVYQFQGSQSLHRKGKIVLDYAFVISSRLHFKNHPSVSNIRRLCLGNLENAGVGSENDVDDWLSLNPLLESL